MGNQNFNAGESSKEENINTTNNQLEWGDHNPRLTDDNFIDRPKKKISDQNELLDNANHLIDLSGEEPGRNRKV